VSIDINYYKDTYFTFDEPVPYELKCGEILYISPISLKNYMLFITSYGILNIDKNSTNDVEIISMSYLKFLVERVFPYSKESIQQFVNICILCMGLKEPEIKLTDNKRVVLYDKDNSNLLITQKEFDDIKKIILYQNLLNFDDSYINPELKESMEELDRLKNKNLEPPSLERRIAIITSHCGMNKKEQLEMTIRSHSLLFQEVSKEVEYLCSKPIAVYAGKPNDVNWIFEKKKGKFDDYITSKETYNRSMGGDGNIIKTNNQNIDLISKYEKFQGG
jgi:hypothetical protein